MASEWQSVLLKDVGITLLDCVHKTPPDAGGGVPYIAIPQMKEGRIDFFANPRLISNEHYVEWTKKAKPQHNDIILSRRCNPGETAYVPPGVEFALGQNLVLLRSDGLKVHPSFLRWLVRGRDWWAQVGKFLNVGAVFDSLKCVEIPKFELPIPPLPEQKAIAHVLGALDDRIELNRRMNETLEGMAPPSAISASPCPKKSAPSSPPSSPTATNSDGSPRGGKLVLLGIFWIVSG